MATTLLLFLIRLARIGLIGKTVFAIGAANDGSTHFSCDAREQDSNQPSTSPPGFPDIDPQYIIIGGGGSGIQAALFLQKYGLSYVILEREFLPGSFWTKFPRFRELISINKWSRNKKHRLRFDWHSMLEAPLDMMDVTKSYFPTGDDWQRYMSEVVQLADLNIEFGKDVNRIIYSNEEEKPCVILSDGDKRCASRRIFVGTGLVEKKEPLLEAMGAIPYSQMTKEMAWQKRVCIFGNGNAGFEVAQNTYDVAEKVTVIGKNAHRTAAITKYTGDVRIKFMQVLENFHFKLLDTVDQADAYLHLSGLENVLGEKDLDMADFAMYTAIMMERDACEVSVIATGFRSQIPGMNLTSRFPDMGPWYESTEVPRVHYIGWHMHKFDFQTSAGGFLHGFRYLIRNLMHYVRKMDDNVDFPRLKLTKNEVVHHVAHRLDVVSDLILLQDGVILRDVILPAEDAEDTYFYYESVTFQFHDEIMTNKKLNDTIFVYFVWGDTRRAQDVFDNVNRYTDTKALRNIHIHPAIEVNGVIREMEEDIALDWSHHRKAINATIHAALNGDLSAFRPISKKPYKRTVVNATKQAQDSHERGPGGGGYDVVPSDFITAVVRSILSKFAPDALQGLTQAIKHWLPFMFQS